MRKDLEIRANKGIEVRAAPDGTDYIGVLEGYASVFNSDSVEFDSRAGPWVEQVAPGAFKRSLETRTDVKALWNHDAGQIIARSPNTLNLSEDERGLKVEISLVDTSLNRGLMANVRAGNVDAMSFGFEVVDDAMEKREGKTYRILRDVELHEVSAVVWPAYPDTALASRSVENFLQAQEADEPADDGEQEPKQAPLRSIWGARLGINPKPQGESDE